VVSLQSGGSRFYHHCYIDTAASLDLRIEKQEDVEELMYGSTIGVSVRELKRCET